MPVEMRGAANPPATATESAIARRSPVEAAVVACRNPPKRVHKAHRRGPERSANMKKRLSRILGFLALTMGAATLISAQTFTVLKNFGSVSNDPNDPRAPGIIAQGRDGNMYSSSPQTWTGQPGDAFGVSPTGVVTDLFEFDGTNGSVVSSGLSLGDDGNFYGATIAGGAFGFGTVFRLTPAGVLTTLHNFTNGKDGAEPSAPPIQGVYGNYYGNASSCAGLPPGNECTLNGTDGAIYKITPDGAFSVLHTFSGPDGINPLGELVQANDGNIYGTAMDGGANGVGTIFKIGPGGDFTRLFTFDGAHGTHPSAGLILGRDGNLYGNTTGGGSSNSGVLFRITPGGAFKIIYDFADSPGSDPVGGIVQATDGNFYGTTNFGGSSGNGLIYRVTPGGAFTTIANFDGGNGSTPQSSMLQHTNGLIYGQTAIGGSVDEGVFFSVDLGLRLFIKPLPASGPVGAQIGILGQGLTGTTGVSFNGTPADFTAQSDTYLTATVPAGATTGILTVDEPGSKLEGNVKFRVMPQIEGFTPTSGPTGTAVVITGNSFTQATAVYLACKFAMKFTVDSDTQITATVPENLTTGEIEVFTLGGHVESTARFTVTP
jgi:uncharacterized repeat protein (TIGR03803 family)